MNGKFSKWNKRLTVWALLIVGFYMGFMQYPIEYVGIFLINGMLGVGLSIYQNVKSGLGRPKVKFGDLPPKEKEQK
jgi:hypothetical protein